MEGKVDRKAASKLLKVSIRTVDRYIKLKKLSTLNDNGRIWLDKKEIINFASRQKIDNKVDTVYMSTPKMSIDNSVDKAVDTVYKPTKQTTNQNSEGIYKTLFQTAREDLKEKQERLEMANYRVGQLEAQLRNTVPLLEYKKEHLETEQLVRGIRHQVKTEKFKKSLAYILFFILLGLQPLWLLFLLK